MIDDSPETGAAKSLAQEGPEGTDATLPKEAMAVQNGIPTCCISTIEQHVLNNPMMVCAECKNIIKCFVDERAYDNYLKFCRSRRRPVLTGKIQNHWTIAFRSYDTYTR